MYCRPRLTVWNLAGCMAEVRFRVVWQRKGKMKLKLTTLFAIVTLTLIGCSTETINDSGISTKVKSQLAADTETSAIKIAVDTTNRVVTLSGVVPTEKEKAKAEQI